MYPARVSDGKLCPKCNGGLFLPIKFLNHKTEMEENEHVDLETRAEIIGHNRQTRLENNRSESRRKQGRCGPDDADNIKSTQSRARNLCFCGRGKGDNA